MLLGVTCATLGYSCVQIGILLEAMLVDRYIHQGLKLTAISYPSILGLLLIILGFQTFGFTLLLEMSLRVASSPDE